MDKQAAHKKAVRTQICNQCDRRSDIGPELDADAVRECERSCELFIHLPRLAALAHRSGDMPPCGYAIVVQSLVCQELTGHDCKSCRCDQAPLVRYANEVFAVLTTSK